MKNFSLIETAFFLKNTSLFQELELDLLVAIAEKIHQDIYHENETIFAIDDRATKIYFVGKGNVEIVDENEKSLKILEEEDFFGEEALFNNQPRTYSSICKNEVLILGIYKAHFMTIISECPSVAIALLEIYTQTMKNRYNKSI